MNHVLSRHLLLGPEATTQEVDAQNFTPSVDAALALAKVIDFPGGHPYSLFPDVRGGVETGTDRIEPLAVVSLDRDKMWRLRVANTSLVDDKIAPISFMLHRKTQLGPNRVTVAPRVGHNEVGEYRDASDSDLRVAFYSLKAIVADQRIHLRSLRRYQKSESPIHRKKTV